MMIVHPSRGKPLWSIEPRSQNWALNCPLSIQLYNRVMGGGRVEKADQLRGYYYHIYTNVALHILSVCLFE